MIDGRAPLAGGFPRWIAQAVGMARRKNAMMKFVVPAAITLGKRAVVYWPLVAAGLGGMLLARMWSGRKGRSLSASRVGTWAATDATPTAKGSDPSAPTWRSNAEAWSPTAPTGA